MVEVHNKTVQKMEDLLQLVSEGTVFWGAGASKNGGRRPPFLRVMVQILGACN